MKDVLWIQKLCIPSADHVSGKCITATTINPKPDLFKTLQGESLRYRHLLGSSAFGEICFDECAEPIAPRLFQDKRIRGLLLAATGTSPNRC